MVIVDLVKHDDRGLVRASQFLERLVDHLYLLLKVGMRDVNDVNQQVCFTHLVERRLKGIYQIGRQLADKPYGVGQQKRQVADDNLSHSSVEGGEELVLSKDLTLGQQIHDRRLTDVGVAHKSHTDEPSTVFALCGLLFVDLFQPLFQQAHTVEDNSAVHLELGLTRSTQSY